MIHLIDPFNDAPICGASLRSVDMPARDERTLEEYEDRIRTCHECLELRALWLGQLIKFEEANKPTRKERFESWLQGWSNLGESDYDVLPVIAIGICTLGLGLIPMYAMKHSAKLYFRLKHWRPKK